uniref:Growth arrest-specific protein 8 n=1 Tax=Knipowitschia caucasica TaxID=637954 RepID=A0AAV2IVG6_KNICA
MPPKKQTGKKPSPPPVIDGLNKDETSKEQLEEQVRRLRQELQRQKNELNYFSCEREMVRSVWDVTERQQQEAQALLRNLDQDMEEATMRHQAHMKIFRQKMRYLLLEHHNAVCELDAVDWEEELQNEQAALQNQIRDGMASLLTDALQVDCKAPLRLRQKHESEVATLRDVLEKNLRDADDEEERAKEELRRDLELKTRSEVSLVLNHWNTELTALSEMVRAAVREARALRQPTEHQREILREHQKFIKAKSSGLKSVRRELTLVLQEKKQRTEELTTAQETIATLHSKIKSRNKNIPHKKKAELNQLIVQHQRLLQRQKEVRGQTQILHMDTHGCCRGRRR